MVATTILFATLCQQALPFGKATIELDLQGTKLQVFTYKPRAYTGKRMIMVFHGVLRNAEEYRDHSQAMADRFNALVVAPLFDATRFASIKYQRGGILRADGTAAPEAEWTYELVPKIAAQIKALERKPDMPHFIIGHSAGGQFVMRMAGFFDSGAERVVAANPGSDLFPTRDAPFGYGFGSLPESLASDDRLKKYLAQPLTIYLGSADNIPDPDFDMSAQAMRQGGGRYERGIACFEMGKKVAAEKGWPFGWRLYVARMIPHDHDRMFNHPIAELAFFGNYLKRP